MSVLCPRTSSAATGIIETATFFGIIKIVAETGVAVWIECNSHKGKI
jgi:hypothetical protein